MKNLFVWLFSGNNPQGKQLSFAILFFRIFSGLMMIPYGVGKIEKFDEYTVDFFGDPLGIGMIPSLLLTIFAQLVCSLFLIAGFQTRISALILAFNMAVATKFHFFDPFSIKALPILFLGMYCMLVMLGGGKYSLDACLFRKQELKECRCMNMGECQRVWYMVLAFIISSVVFANFFTGIVSLILLIAVLGLLVSSFCGFSLVNKMLGVKKNACESKIQD